MAWGTQGRALAPHWAILGGGFHARLDAFLGEFGAARWQGDAGHFGSGVEKGAVGVFSYDFGKVGSAGIRVFQGFGNGLALAVQGFRSAVFNEFFGAVPDVLAEVFHVLAAGQGASQIDQVTDDFAARDDGADG